MSFKPLPIASLFAVLVACAADEPPAPNNGVNDVRKACEIRATWKRRTDVACTDCMSGAQAPPCECPAFQQEYAAKCNQQTLARAQEPSCDPTYDCVGKCDPADCACVDACYAGREACRARASAEQGCIADVCAAYCQ